MVNAREDRPSGDSAPGPQPEALVAATELERRRYESRRRLDKLSRQRRALEEVRDALAAEEGMLLERISVAEEQRSRLIDRLDAATRRIMHASAEIDALDRELAALDRRLTQSMARGEDLAAQQTALQEQIATMRTELSNASVELEQGRSALARLDRRLSTSGLSQ